MSVFPLHFSTFDKKLIFPNYRAHQKDSSRRFSTRMSSMPDVPIYFLPPLLLIRHFLLALLFPARKSLNRYKSIVEDIISDNHTSKVRKKKESVSVAIVKRGVGVAYLVLN